MLSTNVFGEIFGRKFCLADVAEVARQMNCFSFDQRCLWDGFNIWRCIWKIGIGTEKAPMKLSYVKCQSEAKESRSPPFVVRRADWVRSCRAARVGVCRRPSTLPVATRHPGVTHWDTLAVISDAESRPTWLCILTSMTAVTAARERDRKRPTDRLTCCHGCFSRSLLAPLSQLRRLESFWSRRRPLVEQFDHRTAQLVVHPPGSGYHYW